MDNYGHHVMPRTRSGHLAASVNVEAILTNTDLEDIFAVLAAHRQRRIFTEALEHPAESEQGRATCIRMLNELASISPRQALIATRRIVETTTSARWSMMREAREGGMTWAEIGGLLGITRQGAIDWYRRKLTELKNDIAPHELNRALAVLRDDGDGPEIHPPFPQCGVPASQQVEAYSTTNTGTTPDAIAFACSTHHHAARTEWLAEFNVRDVGEPPKPTCGTVIDQRRTNS
ncbi:hypothetical protein AB0H71_29705 [Nocardia sp. NPDC050697]|uniref:hypothetical protein n=1 Tax=Nocardia sp. NPDC050697 TaxID=3155158 RepID=UPI0033E564F3